MKSNRGIKTGTMECIHVKSLPGMLLSDSFEPDFSHTSILYYWIQQYNHLMKKYRSTNEVIFINLYRQIIRPEKSYYSNQFFLSSDLFPIKSLRWASSEPHSTTFTEHFLSD